MDYFITCNLYHVISILRVVSNAQSKFGNSHFIFGTVTGREVASLKWGLSRDQEEDVPECSVREISRIFREKIWYPKNETGNADLYHLMPLHKNKLRFENVTFIKECLVRGDKASVRFYVENANVTLTSYGNQVNCCFCSQLQTTL